MVSNRPSISTSVLKQKITMQRVAMLMLTRLWGRAEGTKIPSCPGTSLYELHSIIPNLLLHKQMRQQWLLHHCCCSGTGHLTSQTSTQNTHSCNTCITMPRSSVYRSTAYVC